MIFGCWYTVDYVRWLPRLQQSVSERGFRLLGLPVERDALKCRDWETATMFKAKAAQTLLDMADGETLVLIDVDAELVASSRIMIDELNIQGDVGFHVRCIPGKPSRHRPQRHLPRSGTIVFRPTPGTQRFLSSWSRWSARMPRFETDETAMIPAMAESNATFSFLPPYVAWLPGDPGEPVIRHFGAGPRTPRLKRWLCGQSPIRKVFGK